MLRRFTPLRNYRASWLLLQSTSSTTTTQVATSNNKTITEQQKTIGRVPSPLDPTTTRVATSTPRVTSAPLSPETADDTTTGTIHLRRGTHVPTGDDTTGLVEAARPTDVKTITVTKEHVVQQSGTPDIHGEVVGHTEGGVPVVMRTPDVAVPESYVGAEELTATYFELPDGFDQSRFYYEVARENLSLWSLLALPMSAWYWSWNLVVPGGIPVVAAGIAVVQRLLSRLGSTKIDSSALVACGGGDGDGDRLAGKICVVTGASSGTGLYTAIGFATRGADVICSTRRPVNEFWKQWDAALPKNISKDEREAINKRVSVTVLDLAEFESVRRFCDFVRDRLVLHAKAHGRLQFAPAKAGAAEGKSSKSNNNNKKNISNNANAKMKPPPLDILVNNAGLMTSTLKYNSANFEMHLAANVLGPVYLTELLLPNVIAATRATTTSSSSSNQQQQQQQQETLGRVVNVTSLAHIAVRDLCVVQRDLIPRTFDKNAFNFNYRYGMTKLLNIYYTDALARRGIRAVSVAPGGVATSFFRDNAPSIGKGGYAHYPSLILLRTPEEGANNIVFASLCKSAGAKKPWQQFVPGAFYGHCSKRDHAKSALAMNDKEREDVLGWLKGQLPLKALASDNALGDDEL